MVVIGLPHGIFYSLTAACLLMTSPALNVRTTFATHPQKASEQDLIRSALQRGETLTLVRILGIATQRAPGDVIKIELENKQGRLVYEIKVLTPGGNVVEVKVDARSGAILQVEDD